MKGEGGRLAKKIIIKPTNALLHTLTFHHSPFNISHESLYFMAVMASALTVWDTSLIS